MFITVDIAIDPAQSLYRFYNRYELKRRKLKRKNNEEVLAMLFKFVIHDKGCKVVE